MPKETSTYIYIVMDVVGYTSLAVQPVPEQRSEPRVGRVGAGQRGDLPRALLHGWAGRHHPGGGLHHRHAAHRQALPIAPKTLI